MIKKFCLAALLAAASAAHASPITYVFTGPEFQRASGVFTAPGSRITGQITFDSAALDADGTGGFMSSKDNPNSDVTWSFTDGYSTFSDKDNPYRWMTQFYFYNFYMVSWNVETAPASPSRIILNNYEGRYYTYYGVGNGSYGSSSMVSTEAWARLNDTPTSGDVPEPASIALFGLGAAALAALRRRQAR